MVPTVNFDDPLHPIYTVAVLSAVAVLAWVLSYLVPFYRRELAVETRTRLTPLDGLRGLLCFAVLCHHAAVTYRALGTGVWEVPPTPFYALLGQTPVALFFGVTAFLFWSRVVAREGDLPPGAFLRARLFRLGPLYVFSALLALGLVAGRVRWSPEAVAGAVWTVGSLGARNWGTVGGVPLGTINANVTWTLQFEWGFYLLLPALALIARHPGEARRLWFLALGALVLFKPSALFFFLPGVLAVYAARQPRCSAWLRSPPAAFVVLAAVLAFPWLTPDGFGYLGLALTTLIFVPIACGNPLFEVLNWRGLRLMGLVSYSVYLLHGLVLYAARPFLIQAKFALPVEAWWYWYCAAGVAAATLVVSLLTYRWIEWPFMQLERRLRQARPPAAVEVATSLDLARAE